MRDLECREDLLCRPVAFIDRPRCVLATITAHLVKRHSTGLAINVPNSAPAPSQVIPKQYSIDSPSRMAAAW